MEGGDDDFRASKGPGANSKGIAMQILSNDSSLPSMFVKTSQTYQAGASDRK